MRHLRRAAVRQIVFGVIAVAALALAVVLFSRGGSKSDAPTDKFVELYCAKCDHEFKLSYRDFEQMMDKRQFKMAEGGGRGLLFRCGKCSQLTAERGTKPDRPADAATKPASPSRPGRGQ